MKKQFFLVLTALLGGLGLNSVRAEYPVGAVKGVFSVGTDTKVVFANGNLRYKKSNGEWRFADQQYDIVGADNSRIDKSTYGGYIDLFGWGTGANPIAYSCTACETTFDMAGNDPDGSTPYEVAGRRNAPMDYEDFTDWGSHAIANGGNQEGLWRTLTGEEWRYLFFVRANHAERFGLGKVNDVQGLILLPDEWTLPDNVNFVDAQTAGLLASEAGTYDFPNAGPDVNNYTQNEFSAERWQAMEDNGAVFLPAAGSRAGTEYNNDGGNYGFYWASDAEEDDSAYSLGFTESLVAPKVSEPRASGQSVRLVQRYSAPEEQGDDVNVNFSEHPFTVNEEGGQVYFSQGNLQYQPEPGKSWRFAPKQTDFAGEANSNVIDCKYEGWLDSYVYSSGNEGNKIGYNLFHGNCGEMGEDDEFDSPSRRNAPMGFDEDFIDWGINPISNGGNVAGKWRTMTADEWSYLFLSRDNAGLLFGFATVDGVKGLILLPDDWTLPSGCTTFVPASEHMTATEGVYTSNTTLSVYGHNTYYTTNQTWQSMEAAGAVFLPAAGMRTKSLCSGVGSMGYYWTSYKDDNNGDNAIMISFDNTSLNTQISDKKEDGRSVRLVRDLSQETHTLTVVADPTAGGMVMEIRAEGDIEITGSEFSLTEGETKTLKVVATDGYEFAGWDMDLLAGTGSQIEAADVEGEWHFTMGDKETTLKAKFTQIVHTHNWGTPTYSWDGFDCTAERVCTLDPTHKETETVTATQTSTTEPICTEAGVNTYTAVFQNTAFAQQTTTVTIEALGHDWGEPTYTWSNDNSQCTATRVCNRDASHVETETVNSVVTSTATTCEESGTLTYTAIFENVAFATQEKTETVEAVGHDWGEPTYTWSNDNSQCTATRVCNRDASHVERETVSSVEETTSATCDAAGAITYTATFANEAFAQQTTTVEIPALGHDWGNPTYVWSNDNSQCTATRVCNRDASHVEAETVNSSVTSSSATCETAGVTTYTATFSNSAFVQQTKTENVPALGHDWNITYTWSEDHATCTATAVCGNDASHNSTETSTATVTMEGGVTTYTATFSNTLFVTQTFSYTSASSITVTMSEYGFLSLYADKAYIVPSDLKAYIYTGISGRDLTYQLLTVIPAYTGVFFEGIPNKTYTLYETETTFTYPENMLHGTLTNEVINDADVHYILTRLENSNKGGLYWPKGTDRGVGAFTNHAGKAYLAIPASAGVAPRYFTMRGKACEEVTAVDETEAEGDGKLYDVLGREVRDPQPQQIYIRNGQKVLYGE